MDLSCVRFVLNMFLFEQFLSFGWAAALAAKSISDGFISDCKLWQFIKD